MKKQEIQNALAKLRNGTYTNITFLSDLTPNKESKGHKVQKRIDAVVRLGVAYSHIQVDSIQARKITEENGTPLTEKLPWGEWDPECKYLINHTKEDKMTGELKTSTYLRCTISRNTKHRRNVTYLLDGVEVTKEEIAPYVRPSELAPKDREEYVFNPKIENVLALGKKL